MDSFHNHQAAWWQYLRLEDRKGYLSSRSQITQTEELSHFPTARDSPNVVQRRERNDQDIISHVIPGPDGIALVSQSISRQRRIIKMDDEESKIPDPVTPSKHGSETPVLRTPQGGVLYNPFQKDYVSRLGAPTLTPGLFATPKRRVSGDDSEHSGSVFSPEIQGDHFPTEIDENPIYQVKLQQKLDAAVDKTAQEKIAKYFKTNVVAPSPGFSSQDGRPELRKSSTWKNDRMFFLVKSAFEPNKPKLLKSSQVIDAQTQTSLLIAAQTDFDDLLKKIEQIEEFKRKFGDDFLRKLGIELIEAAGEQHGLPYDLHPNAACSYCHRKNRSFYGSTSVSGDFSRDETIKNTTDSSSDTINLKSDISSFQDEFALPFSFMTESVCSPQPKARSSGSRTNLTSCFNDIVLDNRTPTARKVDRFEFLLGCGIPSSAHRDCTVSKLAQLKKEEWSRLISPLVGGRTSYEAERSFQRFSDSFHLEEEDSGAPFGEVVCFDDDESTRDVPNNKENLEANQSSSRKRLMESPNLSPIFARRRKYDFDDKSDAPMDEGIRTRLFERNDSNR
ncbi:hypothetical protein ACTXT7_008540 [Hymenolepis weldensis]